MPKVTSAPVIKWLGSARFERLGDRRAAVLRQVVKVAPNVPTAALRVLQLCDVMPSDEEVARWQAETAPAAQS